MYRLVPRVYYAMDQLDLVEKKKVGRTGGSRLVGNVPCGKWRGRRPVKNRVRSSGSCRVI